jgi:hypothetical protein
MSDKLTPAEDEELRLLAALAAYGALSETATARFADLRARDRRDYVREPRGVVMPEEQAREDGPLAHA